MGKRGSVRILRSGQLNWQPQAPLTMSQHGKSKSCWVIKRSVMKRSGNGSSPDRSKRLLSQRKQRNRQRYLFVEVDGLYTKLQRSRRRVKENKIAIIHEGWERLGKRIQLKNKTHYLHTGSGSTFCEGFGDFLIEHYDVDEDTWLVVNGDGAEWIGECESYFHRCIYTLD